LEKRSPSCCICTCFRSLRTSGGQPITRFASKSGSTQRYCNPS
jgi:hypothetical protein